MRKPPAEPPAKSPDPRTPAWAADWITTPPADDDAPDYAGELADDGREPAPLPTAKDVIVALAGGALAGLTVYAMHRFAKPLIHGEAIRPRRRGQPAKRKPRGGAASSAKRRTAKPARHARTMREWLDEAKRLEEAIRNAQAEAQRRARASAEPPVVDEDAEDRAAAALLGVGVDASAEEIGKAWRRLVRQRMQAGAFHDQPGADMTETARLITAKNRLVERARRRAAGGGGVS